MLKECGLPLEKRGLESKARGHKMALISTVALSLMVPLLGGEADAVGGGSGSSSRSSSGRQSPVQEASGSRPSSPSGSRPASPAQASSSGASSSQKVLTREQAQEILTEGVLEFQAPVIEGLGKVPAEDLTPRFIEVVQDLTQGMNGFNKSKVIKALGGVPAERLTEDFIEVVQELTKGMGWRKKSQVIADLGRMPKKRLTPRFVNFVQGLTKGMDCDKYGASCETADVIAALGAVPENRLTPRFIEVLQTLTKGMGGLEKSLIIKALREVPENLLTPEFINVVEALSKGSMKDGLAKAHLIASLREMPENSLTPRFGEVLQLLTEEIDDSFYKAEVIRDLAAVPLDRLDAFEDFLNTRGRLGKYHRGRLLQALSKVEAWDAEIAQELIQYGDLEFLLAKLSPDQWDTLLRKFFTTPRRLERRQLLVTESAPARYRLEHK